LTIIINKIIIKKIWFLPPFFEKPLAINTKGFLKYKQVIFKRSQEE
jgi:hypothetical protein